jgi:hypothetical protein
MASIAPFEQGEIGPDLFRAACEMGLEGLVSKHRERDYRAVKSPKHPADDASQEGVRVDLGQSSPYAAVRSRSERAGANRSISGANPSAITEQASAIPPISS